MMSKDEREELRKLSELTRKNQALRATPLRPEPSCGKRVKPYPTLDELEKR